MLHSSDFIAKSTSYQCFYSSHLGYIIGGIHSLKKKKNPFITNAVVAQTGEGGTDKICLLKAWALGNLP
jgi:hypothetical protein